MDVAIHTDNPDNPHAHLLQTTREIGSDGFGAPRRDWNGKERLLQWRARWGALTNEHLRRVGIEIEIDHRSLQDQGIDLIPGRKISRERQETGRAAAQSEREGATAAVLKVTTSPEGSHCPVAVSPPMSTIPSQGVTRE